jgi:hypothetical protein
MQLVSVLEQAANLVERIPDLDAEEKLKLTVTFTAAAHRLSEHGDPDEESTTLGCEVPEEPEE